MIRVTKAQDFKPVAYTVLGWDFKNIEEVVTWLQKRGVVFEKYPFVQDQELGIWTAPVGDKVAWFKDPDGNGSRSANTTGVGQAAYRSDQ